MDTVKRPARVRGMMYDAAADTQRTYGQQSAMIVVYGLSRQGVDSFLDERIRIAREEPERMAKLVEDECLLALSTMHRQPGPEHEKKPTGRRAGGGTLKRGS